jgi:7-cyano-7-deazaguanine reductase
MAYGQLVVPASSENLVESKSLKLYFNSLNNHRFASDAEAVRTIEHDVGTVVRGGVELLLASVDDAVLAGSAAPGRCLDELSVGPDGVPDRSRLEAAGRGELQCYTHAMRSLCPVTAQPDWATVLVHVRGALPEDRALAAYLWSYRDHQEFHEQCVERIYTDLQLALQPEYLSVYALYTRRGGIAISPWRCSAPDPAPRMRLNRQ